MTYFCNIPDEIGLEILARLPPKSLMRFKCVRKSWYVLFNNPHFVAEHLRLYNDQPSSSSTCILFKRSVLSTTEFNNEELVFSFLSLRNGKDSDVDHNPNCTVEDLHFPHSMGLKSRGQFIELPGQELGESVSIVGGSLQQRIWIYRLVLRSNGSCKLGGQVLQYKTLVEEHHESKPLEGVVMADEVRPLPPQPSREKADLGFDVLDRVDVLDNKGWWVGTVTEKRGEDKYWVYFETTADHIAYPKRILRFHKDWIDGMWVNYNKKKRAFRADGKPEEFEDYKKVRIDGKLVDWKSKLRVSIVSIFSTLINFLACGHHCTIDLKTCHRRWNPLRRPLATCHRQTINSRNESSHAQNRYLDCAARNRINKRVNELRPRPNYGPGFSALPLLIHFHPLLFCEVTIKPRRHFILIFYTDNKTKNNSNIKC
ncbi:unnamed protein product [Malus baccata var. baccata]